MNFAIPHSCQTYWWGTSEFFQTMIKHIEAYVEPDLYNHEDDSPHLKAVYASLTTEQQEEFMTTLKNLASMANQLGDNWIHPNNRNNDPNVAERIRNYERLESEFYQLTHSFVENQNYSEIVELITQILRRYVSLGVRFYNAFIDIFGLL